MRRGPWWPGACGVLAAGARTRRAACAGCVVPRSRELSVSQSGRCDNPRAHYLLHHPDAEKLNAVVPHPASTVDWHLDHFTARSYYDGPAARSNDCSIRPIFNASVRASSSGSPDPLSVDEPAAARTNGRIHRASASASSGGASISSSASITICVCIDVYTATSAISSSASITIYVCIDGNTATSATPTSPTLRQRSDLDRSINERRSNADSARAGADRERRRSIESWRLSDGNSSRYSAANGRAT